MTKQEMALLRYLGHTLWCLLPFFHRFGEDECQWQSLQSIYGYSAACLISIVWMEWHPYVSTKFAHQRAQLKHWGSYKFIQKSLYVWRLVLILILMYGTEDIVRIASKASLICYSPLLIFSVSYVQTTVVKWPAQPVGKEGSFDTLKKTYSDLQAYTKDKIAKIGKLSREAAHYVPYSKEEPEKEKNDVNFSGPSTVVSRIDRGSVNLEEDRDLDGIVDGIYKIYM
ncbi:hypothetical protein EC973_005382 [Apophysomyces ossiformis]|uniref:Uncharacterized protein n=1 Tax=Apophysomyces ossiformis TaxID=679940 RepID=A0A8H7BKG1_9FUNG|nr:hypothetical protein EC973_005382 [Apophysomyces ossiformis]